MKRPKSAIPIGNERNRRLANVDGEEIDLDHLTFTNKVRLAYGHERTRWESMKVGSYVSYVFPKSYAGTDDLCVDGDPSAVVQKGRKSEWKMLADWLKQNHVKQVKAFMACVFDHHLVTFKRAPEPAHLRKLEYITLWRETKDKLDERVRVSLGIQREMAQTEFLWRRKSHDAEEAWTIVLLSERLELSPLFRYCIAKGLGMERFDKIAARFHADAIMQFERYRVSYKRHWGKLLPEGFSRESEKLYPHLVVA